MTVGTADVDAHAHAGRFTWALMLLALAGAIDAAAFSHLGGLFVSFMSGNTTQGAVAAAKGEWSQALAIGGVLLAFVVGVAAGDLAAGDPPRRSGAVLLAEAVLVAVASRSGNVAAPLLALAMGMHNGLALKAERIGLALTYVTGTLVHLGRALADRVRGKAAPRAWPYAAMWCALATGAVVGGFGAHLGRTLEFEALASMLAIVGIGDIVSSWWSET